ncbi:MAG TPA: cyclic nucleotide-binding domain-containing protein [Chloroflexota bacterium]|jgi:CRP/FNR family transcriptional regulator
MAELDAATRMTTARRGRVIYHQEDTAEGLFLLKAGRVRLFRVAPGGKKLDLAVLEPGTFFGELEAEGIVELGRRRLRVLDRARLAQALDE